MGNSTTSFLPTYNCYDENVSRNSVTPEYWDSHSINDTFKHGSIATAVLILLFMLIGLPGNALIIVSIIQQKLYKETTHILLLNLAISDFLVCLLVMPFIAVAGFAGGYIFGSSDYTRCQVCQTGVIFTILTVLSVNTLGIISVDRFIFIKFPLRYKNWVTIPRLIVIIVLIWLFSIFQGILPTFGFGEIKYGYSFAACVINLLGDSKLIGNVYYGLLLVMLALIPIIITIVTNIWISCIVRKQIMKVYRTRRSFGNKEDLRKYNQSLRKNIHKKRNRKQLVLLRVFGAILIANLIVWMPCTMFVLCLLIIDADLIPLGVYIFVYISFISHTVIHPFVEGCFIPEIKETFKKLLGISFCRNLIKKQAKKRKESTAITMIGHTTLDSSDCTMAGTEEQERSCIRCCDIYSIAVLPSSEYEL